eukprot:m.8193 g.8193  ORF g.8193 m.8193 type:complete len:315 (+) comp3852_c0_seq1:77-1021(+)
MEVQCSGAVLAGVLYDMERSNSDLEGILFGSRHTYNIRSTDDTSESSTTTKKVLSIQAFHPTGAPFSFYNFAEDVNLKTLNMDETMEIIGWFKFRRNTPQSVSYRESQVHKNFVKTLNASFPDIIFMLFTGRLNDNESTHTCEYNVTMYQESTSKFRNLPFHIANLNQSMHEGYRDLSVPTVPSSKLSKGSNAYVDLIANLRKEAKGFMTQDARAVTKAYHDATEQIGSFVTRTEIAQHKVDELEAEVLKLEQALRDNGMGRGKSPSNKFQAHSSTDLAASAESDIVDSEYATQSGEAGSQLLQGTPPLEYSGS